MIDGKPYKTLKRQLSGHGLNPEQYREHYNLSPAGRHPRLCSAGSNGPINDHSSSDIPIRSPNAASKRQF
jgi:hypothetical protein